MVMLNWDFRHINDQRARMIQNSVRLSTYENQYRLRKDSWIPWRGLSILCSIAGLLYLALYFGLFDFLR